MILTGLIGPVSGLGQHPGWVQELPWIRANAWQFQSWSAGETVAVNQRLLLPSAWSLSSGIVRIGTHTRFEMCTGPSIPLSPEVSAQFRVGCLARRWSTSAGSRGLWRPNVHLLFQGIGSDGESATLAIALVPEGRLPGMQSREELVIQLTGFAQRNGQQLRARATWTSAGLAVNWQWTVRINSLSKMGLSWRMLPGYLGIHGSHESRSHRWTFGLLRGLGHQGYCLALGMQVC